jgi:sugar lactone lactonase YvrE
MTNRRQELRRERRRRRRFDPIQKAEEFTTEPAPRTETLSIERRVNLLSNLAKNAMLVASKPPGRQLLETVLELPEASELDVGRQIILRSGSGVADRIYIGMQLDDDSYAWVEASTEIAGLQRTWVRNISITAAHNVATDSAGNVFVSTLNSHRLYRYTAGGTQLNSWGDGVADTVFATGGNDLNAPYGVAWASNTINWPYPVLYVVQSGRHIANAWSTHSLNHTTGLITSVASSYGSMADGDWPGTPGVTGSANTHLNGPRGAAVNSYGDVYIVDANNNRVQRFRAARVGNDYDYTHTGTYSSGPLNSPAGVAVDSNLYVYVSEFGGHRIRKYDNSGTLVTTFGTGPGSGDGVLNAPQQLALDSNNNLHVADSGNDRIQVFDSSGNYVTKYGTSGSGNGQLNNPSGIAIASNGTIFIADNANNRVSVWV